MKINCKEVYDTWWKIVEDTRTFAAFKDFQFSLHEQSIQIDMRDYGYVYDDDRSLAHWWLTKAIQYGPENVITLLKL